MTLQEMHRLFEEHGGLVSSVVQDEWVPDFKEVGNERMQIGQKKNLTPVFRYVFEDGTTLDAKSEWDGSFTITNPGTALRAGARQRAAEAKPEARVIDGRLYERGPDGEWKLKLEAPEKPKPPRTTEVGGDFYEEQPDGTWKKVISAPPKTKAPVTRTVKGSLYEYDEDTGEWKPAVKASAAAALAGEAAAGGTGVAYLRAYANYLGLAIKRGELDFDIARTLFDQTRQAQAARLARQEAAMGGFARARGLQLQGAQWAAAPGLTHFPGWEQGGAAAQAARLLGSKFTPVPIQRIPFNPMGDVERVLGGGYDWPALQPTVSVPPPAPRQGLPTEGIDYGAGGIGGGMVAPVVAPPPRRLPPEALPPLPYPSARGRPRVW